MDDQCLLLRVADGDAPISKRYVSQMGVLNLCRNDSPYFSSCKKEEIKLLVDAFDAAKNGNMESFLRPLSEEYFKSCKDKSIGEGKLRMLLNIAEKLQATELSALCMLHILPSEINVKISGCLNVSSKCAGVKNSIDRYIIQKSCKRVNPVVEYYTDYSKPLSVISSCGSKKAEVSSSSGLVTVYDPIPTTTLNKLVIAGNSPTKSVTNLSFSGNSQFLSVCVKNKLVGFLNSMAGGSTYHAEVWDLGSSQKIYTYESCIKSHMCVACLNHNGTIMAIAEYPEWKLDTWASESAEIRLCDVKNAQSLYTPNLSCPCLPKKITIQDDARLLCCAKDITCEFQLNAGKDLLQTLNYVQWMFLLKVYSRVLCNPKSVKNNILYGLLPQVIQKWVLYQLEQAKWVAEYEKNSEEPCSIS